VKHKDDVASARLPVRILSVGVLLNVIIVLWFGWQATNAYRAARMSTRSREALIELRGVILHLDEVLTMSARMAAATGDTKWETRYRQYEPELDRAIKRAIALAPQAEIAEAARKTDSANIALVAMEDRAFELVRDGRGNEARQVLFSATYEAQKRIYSDGMNELMAGLSAVVGGRLERQWRDAIRQAMLLVVLIPLLIVGWYGVFRAARKWEVRMRERNRALVDANVRLRRESAERRRAEDELRRARDNLEIRVRERTEELAVAAREWQETFDAIDDMVVIIDADRKVLRVNRATREVLGGRQAIGAHCYELFHGTAGPPEGCPAKAALETGEPARSELFEPHLGGRWLDVSAWPIKDRAGKVVQLVHLVRDITERKQTEKMLMELEMLRAGQDLAAWVAHNFNNLLSGILGYIGFARESLQGRGLPLDDIERALECTERAAALAGKLRRWTRPASEHTQTISMGSLVDKLVTEVRRSLPANIGLRVDAADSAARIEVPVESMLEALTNICDNASEAMPDGGTLTISAADSRRESGMRGLYAVISVSDSGVGISPEALDKVFDPFFSTKSTVGVGLSLALTRRIVVECGGEIEVQSEPGKGSTFRVFLPVSQPKEEPSKECQLV